MEEINEKKVVLVPNGGYPMHTYEDVKELFFTYIHNQADRDNILKAYKFAEKKHAGIFRKSGEPYVQHLIEVAYICAQLQAGPVTIEAAFLHDVVEDTETTIQDIEDMFGEDCAKIVDSLTKIQRLKLSHRTQEEFEAEDHRKIFLGMAKDVRVIIIKLADRLHNMRTIESLSKERQLALAKETIEVFAPIAHRLGIYKVESELEDLSLKVLKPSIYNEISELVNNRVRERGKAHNNFKKKLGDIAFTAHIPFDIESRVKSIYSIYKKMYEKNRKFDEIYDVLALRIITDTTLHCYELLGLIHQEYKPIPGRFKDYIAVPKSNMYQSLHTTIVSTNGQPLEIQIRTFEMHRVSEYGVAAHWRYKESGNSKGATTGSAKDVDAKMSWLRQLLDWHQDMRDPKEFVNTVKMDVFSDEVFVFTPQGDVIDLPVGSVPIDFACSIHTGVGNTFTGAKVNGKIVPLDYKLSNGDIVVVTTKQGTGPSRDWLNIVGSNETKNKIREWFKKERREENVVKGRE